MSRRGYDGVAVAVPVTVPYVRYSIRAAHWWLARALAQLLEGSGLKKDELDGLAVSGESVKEEMVTPSMSSFFSRASFRSSAKARASHQCAARIE